MAALTYRRFSVKVDIAVWVVFLAAVTALTLGFGLVQLDNAALISLLPLTAYLPTAVLFFVMSKRNVVSNFFVLMMALLADIIVQLVDKVLLKFVFIDISSGILGDILLLAINIVTTALTGIIIFVFIRKTLAREQILAYKNWYILLVMFLLEALSLYEIDSTTDNTAVILLTVIDISVFGVIIGYILAKYRTAESERKRSEIVGQLELERGEYRLAEQKLELSRRYRHDMRHHLAAIKGMLKQQDYDKISEYVDELCVSGYEFGSDRKYTSNAVINAVLSRHIAEAEAMGAEVSAGINIPETLPFDNTDICALISNTLENAVNALKNVDGKKKLTIFAEYDSASRFCFTAENSASGKAELDENGMPVVTKHTEDGEMHGLGLKSVRYIVDKYSGIMQCSSGEDTFRVSLAIFSSASKGGEEAPRKSRLSRKARVVIPLIFVVPVAAVVTINCMPSTLDALAENESVKAFVDIIDFREWNIGWGSSGFGVEAPVTDNSEINHTIDGFIEKARATFLEYYARKNGGYVATDVNISIPLNDDNLTILHMAASTNAASTLNYEMYAVYSKMTGEMLTPDELFAAGSGWEAALDGYIADMIAYRISSNGYEGGDWAYYGYGIYDSEEDMKKKFTSLSDIADEDHSFYIDENDSKLVIFVNENVLSPISECVYEFDIETLLEYLAEDSVLKEYIE